MFTSPISKYSRFLPSISGQSSESSVSPIFATYSPQFVGATEFHPKEIADFNSISASPSQGQVKLRLRRPQWRRVELAPKGQKLGLALTRRQDMNTGIWIRHEHVNIVNVYVLSKLWVILLPNRTR